ncbi:MAG: hypothetical protein GY845_03320 [Planctomycetes bacterium]|nr:hypothetical protein [Planctomycetota bacterium]
MIDAISHIDPSQMSRADKEAFVLLLQEKQRRIATNKIDSYYPSDGPLARSKYAKHTEFFALGAKYPERCIMAANRVGKSEGIGAYETTLHASGKYPPWWVGKRFDKPITCWAAGTTGTTSRDIVQFKLLGQPENRGTGMIPGDLIVKTTPKAGGVPNAVDTILVRHISGGLSRIKIKSYAEGRKSFEGTEQDFIWLDEECPLDIYTECLTRTMTTDGHIILTFTPLAGITQTVLMFLPGGNIKEWAEGSRCLIMATWDDVPHITKKQKAKLLAGLPPAQRAARSRGIPSMGSGVIYPVLEEDITCDPFAIPKHYLCAYGLDVGWNRTAALWAAIDPDTKICYVYSDYYRSQAEPIIHVTAINARGEWIPGVIDPASRGRGQKDGSQLFKDYRRLGLNIRKADNTVDAGLTKVWNLLSTGKLKIFSTCLNTLAEYRLYHRNEKGDIVKENDHLMDALRYLIMSGLNRAIVKPPIRPIDDPFFTQVNYGPRDAIVGL